MRALEKDGWTITDDPLTLPFNDTILLIDIGAESTIGAERDGERIAVEIKSFLRPSEVQDLRDAVGQYFLYGDTLADTPAEADRKLYLTVRDETYRDVLSKPQTAKFLRNRQVRLIVFDPEQEVITQWIK